MCDDVVRSKSHAVQEKAELREKEAAALAAEAALAEARRLAEVEAERQRAEEEALLAAKLADRVSRSISHGASLYKKRRLLLFCEFLVSVR